MWPFTRIVPARECESCSKRLEELSERIGKLELKHMEILLDVMDKAEKVAAKLKDRERKRDNNVNATNTIERPRRPWERE